MAKQRSSAGKRDREFRTREREKMKREKAEAKRQRREDAKSASTSPTPDVAPDAAADVPLLGDQESVSLLPEDGVTRSIADDGTEGHNG
jgi:hypothetical protein